MITIANGDKFRDKPDDPTSLPGYILDPDNPKFLRQQFLPCKFRVMRVCSTCPRTKQKNVKPACSKKNITTGLTCVGCLDRATN